MKRYLSALVKFRCSPEMKQRLQVEAAALEIDLSDYLRVRVLGTGGSPTIHVAENLSDLRRAEAVPSSQRSPYGKPIPTKFAADDLVFLQRAALETGLSVSDLVRRSVRLLRRQKDIFRSYGFLLDIA
jgi:hypothetical protein